jgi:hypothetical protein
MAANITSYSGLTAAVAAWLARDGDADLAARADDFIALMEQRLYFGSDPVEAAGIPAMEAVRIPEMYQVNASFTLSQGAAVPDGMLELVEVNLNPTNTDTSRPLEIVEESVLDSQDPDATGSPRYVAVSGNTFRVWPDPGTGIYTVTVRYYGKLSTPSGTTSTNYILTNAPGVYLNGCLLEASLFTGDFEGASRYGLLYASAVGALNTRAQRRFSGAQNLRMKLRGWTP